MEIYQFGLYHGNFNQFFYAFLLGMGFGFTLKLRKTKFRTTVNQLTTKEEVRSAFINVGMIVAYVIFAVLFITSII